MHILLLVTLNNLSLNQRKGGEWSQKLFKINFHESMSPDRAQTLYPWNCHQACICSQTRDLLRYAPGILSSALKGRNTPKNELNYEVIKLLRSVNAHRASSVINNLLQMTTPPVPHSQFQPNITGMCFLDAPLQK